jgi:hypothetical protein
MPQQSAMWGKAKARKIGTILRRTADGALSLLRLQLSIRGKWSTFSFPIRILRCIKHVATHVTDLPRVGILRSAQNTLLVKTSALALFLCARRNGLNKIFRHYECDVVPVRDSMAEVRAARSLETPRDAGWSQPVFWGKMFKVTMLEEEALRIAEEIPANRRRMNHQQTLSLPVSVWLAFLDGK